MCDRLLKMRCAVCVTAILTAAALAAQLAHAAEKPALIEFEAEAASVIKSPLAVIETPGASGGKVLYADPKLWMRADRHVAFKLTPGRRLPGLGLAEYKIKVPRPGRYCSWFLCWFGNPSDDSFFIRMDDGKWSRLTHAKYMAWRWIRGPNFALSAGRHRLQIAGREDNSIMDRLVLCENSRYVPPAEKRGSSAAKSFRFPVPDKPGRADRTVTYLNHFDDPVSASAAAAKGDARMGGMYWKLNQPGRFGKGVLVSHPKAYMLIMGKGNASSDDVTIDFWFRSEKGKDIFSDGKEHYLMTVQFESRMYVGKGPFEERRMRGKDKLTLILDSRSKRLRLKITPVLATVPSMYLMADLPTEGADGRAWHHVALSWQKSPARFWLALDGKGRLQTIPKGWTFEPVLGIFFGSADYYNILKPVGGVLDELRIRNVPLSKLMSR